MNEQIEDMKKILGGLSSGECDQAVEDLSTAKAMKAHEVQKTDKSITQNTGQYFWVLVRALRVVASVSRP